VVVRFWFPVLTGSVDAYLMRGSAFTPMTQITVYTVRYVQLYIDVLEPNRFVPLFFSYLKSISSRWRPPWPNPALNCAGLDEN
jgi:hypothetical protein